MNRRSNDQWKAICAGIIGLSLVTQVSVAAAPYLAVMVDSGKSQILERELTEFFDGLVDSDLAGLDTY